MREFVNTAAKGNVKQPIFITHNSVVLVIIQVDIRQQSRTVVFRNVLCVTPALVFQLPECRHPRMSTSTVLPVVRFTMQLGQENPLRVNIIVAVLIYQRGTDRVATVLRAHRCRHLGLVVGEVFVGYIIFSARSTPSDHTRVNTVLQPDTTHRVQTFTQLLSLTLSVSKLIECTMSARDPPNLRRWVEWDVKKAGKQITCQSMALCNNAAKLPVNQ